MNLGKNYALPNLPCFLAALTHLILRASRESELEK